MERRATIARLYALNLSLLVVHEIDSAYWEEWKLFRLPGGIQLFLLVHVVLVPVLLVGYRQVLLQRTGQRLFSLLVAAAGVFAFSIHMLLIALGHDEFRLPVSIAVLIALLVGSLGQLWLVVSAGGHPSARRQ